MFLVPGWESIQGILSHFYYNDKNISKYDSFFLFKKEYQRANINKN